MCGEDNIWPRRTGTSQQGSERKAEIITLRSRVSPSAAGKHVAPPPPMSRKNTAIIDSDIVRKIEGRDRDQHMCAMITPSFGKRKTLVCGNEQNAIDVRENVRIVYRNYNVVRKL